MTIEYNIPPLALSAAHYVLANKGAVDPLVASTALLLPPLRLIVPPPPPPVIIKTRFSVSAGLGTSTADYISQGLGVYLPYEILSALSQPNFLYLLSVNDLARGDDVFLYQSIRSSLPGDVQKRIALINAFTEALIVLQKHRNDLSGDAVNQAIAYLQTLADVDSASVSQKLSLSMEDPGSLFKSVSSGIYIDGRAI